MIPSKPKQIFSSRSDPFCNMQKPPPLKSSSVSLQDAQLLMLPYQIVCKDCPWEKGREIVGIEWSFNTLLEIRNTEMLVFPSHLL